MAAVTTLVFFLVFLVEKAASFGAPQPFVSRLTLPLTTSLPTSTFTVSDGGVPNQAESSGILGPGGPLSQGTQDALGEVGKAFEASSGLLYNIAIGATAIVFVGAGLTYLIASIVIPAAAKELEKECKELNPELWEEYLAKLEPGETMDRRPELMQELGVKLQPLLDQKIARMNEKNDGIGKSVKSVDSLSATSPVDNVLHVEVEKDDGVTGAKDEKAEKNDRM